MESKRKLLWRSFILAVIFVAVCLFYVIRLAGYQLVGDHSEIYRDYDVKSFTYEVTIPALRGNICDRNGKVIVSTADTYSLAFDFWSMPADKAECNRSILLALAAVRATGSEALLTEDYFPFVGTYPDLVYAGETKTEGTVLNSRLRRVIRRREFDEDIDAGDLVKFYVKKFGMVGADGEPLYTNEEMTDLIRVRYAMDATDFGTYVQYHLAERVPLEVVTYVREQNPLGMVFPRSAERKYNYPGILSHILGSVGAITQETYDYYTDLGYPSDAIVGVSGIEELFEGYLHGTDGAVTITEDEDGNVIESYVSREPVAGRDVWLTIDIDLQVTAERALAEFVQTYSGNAAAGGAFVAIDPATNGALVLASYPTYDLDSYHKDYAKLLADPATPLLNRTLNGLYTPGSTFKLGTATAALEERAVRAGETVYCSGIYTLGTYRMKCWVYPDSHGAQDVLAAITHSCNCFFAEMGNRLGITVMNRYSKLFGLGEPTGIELAESLGSLAGEEYRMTHGGGAWYPADTVMAAIGQSDNAFTPVQICNYVTTLLRGGTRESVHILGSVRTAGGAVIEKKVPEILSSFVISSSTLDMVKTGMMQMIAESPTASNFLRRVPVTVGGKTDTAKVGAENDNGLFVCAAPYNDPEIVIACVIEGGNSGLYSSGIAAAVLETYYGVEKEG